MSDAVFCILKWFTSQYKKEIKSLKLEKTLRMTPLKTSWKTKAKRVSGWSFRKECLMPVKVAGRGVLAKTGVLTRSKYLRDMTNE